MTTTTITEAAAVAYVSDHAPAIASALDDVCTHGTRSGIATAKAIDRLTESGVRRKEYRGVRDAIGAPLHRRIADAASISSSPITAVTGPRLSRSSLTLPGTQASGFVASCPT